MSEELVKEKDKALNKVVHNRDIDMIDELVVKYINGTPKERYDAQTKILEYFDSYIEKYVNLFIGSQIDLGNYDTRGFLGMFLTGRAKTSENFAAQKAYITKVMSRFTKDDIKNELVVLFLGVLNKYRVYPGVNALNPLTKFFRYRTKDWFNRIVKDALFRTVDIDQISGGSEEGDGMTIETWMDTLDPVQVDFDQNFQNFDLAWVRNPGEQIYKELTVYERYLIFLTYTQDLTVAQIAEKLERDKDTIRRHLTAILTKIEGLAENDRE